MNDATRNQPWSHAEVQATVADYLHMLSLELSGQRYNKSEHRRQLSSHLAGRSDSAIEMKHRNISAILIDLGCPYISGYAPLSNYQELLREVVESSVVFDRDLDVVALAACTNPAKVPLFSDIKGLMVDPPQFLSRVGEAREEYRYSPRPPVQRDYLQREARNASLGLAGEEFVLRYEHMRLWSMGSKGLAEKVEHVSRTKGDGLGFDVLSFDANGRERFIEVKTTSFGRETPFYLSRRELAFSKAQPDEFHLYRVFDFRREPRLFDLDGAVETRCNVSPITFLCSF